MVTITGSELQEWVEETSRGWKGMITAHPEILSFPCDIGVGGTKPVADEVILLCVRWYLRFELSYRDLSRIMYELGIAIAPCTILRWVVRYSIELSHRCQRYQKPVGRSWRADDTYVRVSGRWMYLYRAVDELGHTVASHLSRTRDMRAAKTFFRKALKQRTTVSLRSLSESGKVRCGDRKV